MIQERLRVLSIVWILAVSVSHAQVVDGNPEDSSCCVTSNIGSADLFIGHWHFNSDPNAVLTVKKPGPYLYKLQFESPKGKWYGFAQSSGNKLIGTFQYVWNVYPSYNDNGFITFTLLADGRLEFESYYTNGDCRFSGFYQKAPDDIFVGHWNHNGDPNAVLTVSKFGQHFYKLHFISPNGEWHGFAHSSYDKLLGTFQYTWHIDPLYSDDNGFITFNLNSNGELSYETFNSDGSHRFKGFYVRCE